MFISFVTTIIDIEACNSSHTLSLHDVLAKMINYDRSLSSHPSSKKPKQEIIKNELYSLCIKDNKGLQLAALLKVKTLAKYQKN